MSRVHLFNPENDTALAADAERYTPPKAALQLHIDGSLLPMWWAGSDDIVLSPHAEAASRLRDIYGLDCSVTERIDDHQAAAITESAPWGWSRDARRQLADTGVPAHALPTSAELDTLRNLSHRRITIPILEYLSGHCNSGYTALIPKEISATRDIPDNDLFIKLPWSSSGRGVKYYSTGSINAQSISNIEGAIGRYGSVMVEPALDKVADFASLFYSDGHNVRYQGLSLFSTDVNGAYTGNIVATEDYLRSRISLMIDYEKIEEAQRALEEILTALLCPYYKGWMGVDMMIYRDSTGLHALQPCVELNLRVTMGVVAHKLARNERLAQYLPAIFTVGPSAEGLDLLGDSSKRFRFTLQTL